MQIKDTHRGVLTNLSVIMGLVHKIYYSHENEDLDAKFVTNVFEETVRQLYLEYHVISTDIVDKLIDRWEEVAFEEQKYEITEDSRYDDYKEMVDYMENDVLPDVSNSLVDEILISIYGDLEEDDIDV